MIGFIFPNESPEERRERLHKDLLARVRWRYPAEDPVGHLASAAFRGDVIRWYNLGRSR